MWAELLPLLFTLPLLALSGFFSGSETMLFGLSAADRAELRGRHPSVAKRIELLTSDEPRLLVSILMGNTIVNCLFFVITASAPKNRCVRRLATEAPSQSAGR